MPGSRGARRLTILGSTGSIGVNALDVVRRLNRAEAGRFRVVGLSSRNNLDRLKRQVLEFRPTDVALESVAAARAFSDWARARRLTVRVGVGVEGLESMAGRRGTDVVLSAVVGAVGLKPLLAALRRGTDVALANKEALIVAGDLVMAEARRSGARILPVDSEHSAMFQCLGGRTGSGVGVRRILLTASGGAFYRRKGSLDAVSVEEALAHPTWRMGPKITVDSATLTNKGLEAIEAHHLFQVPLEKIQIVIHPQSIVHSLVEFEDGSLLAQLSHPDMRLPIQYALTFPDRCPTPVRRLDLEEVRTLDFAVPNFRRFPCLALALNAGRRGGLHPTVFNAANETAVASFLARRMGFTDIPRLLAYVLRRWDAETPGAERGLSAILKADAWGRAAARRWVDKRIAGKSPRFSGESRRRIKEDA